jgi:hypothetical protein
MKKYNRVSFLCTLLTFVSSTYAIADECSMLSGLPNVNLPSLESFLKQPEPENSSCKLIDHDSFYQDADLKKKWCSKGCQSKITDEQKKVFMPEMASPEAKRWHSNWHTASQLYNDNSLSRLIMAIDQKEASSKAQPKATPTPTGKTDFSVADKMGMASSAPSRILDLKDLKKLSSNELTQALGTGKERVQQFMFYGDVPSLCHTTISVQKRKPIQIKKDTPTLPPPPTETPSPGKTPSLGFEEKEEKPENDFSPEYKTCVEKNWENDLRNFVINNQKTGGENFLYMHHTMRNQVQMMLSNAGLPCIAGWEDIPGPDGKTGHKEGDWEEIWKTSPYAQNQLIKPNEIEEMNSKKLSQSAYLNWKSVEVTKELVQKKNDKGSMNDLKNILEKNGIDVLGKIFENKDFLKSISMNELGRLMEGTIHNRMHGAFSDPSGCKYMDNGKEVDLTQDPTNCSLGSPSGAHIHSTFWKLHGWCDDVINKWMSAGDRKYTQIGTTETCHEKSCYKVNGTWSAGMPQF